MHHHFHKSLQADHLQIRLLRIAFLGVFMHLCVLNHVVDFKISVIC